jgi:hypothetical protein
MQKGWTYQHLDKYNPFYQSANCKLFPSVYLCGLTEVKFWRFCQHMYICYYFEILLQFCNIYDATLSFFPGHNLKKNYLILEKQRIFTLLYTSNIPTGGTSPYKEHS